MLLKWRDYRSSQFLSLSSELQFNPHQHHTENQSVTSKLQIYHRTVSERVSPIPHLRSSNSSKIRFSVRRTRIKRRRSSQGRRSRTRGERSNRKSWWPRQPLISSLYLRRNLLSLVFWWGRSNPKRKIYLKINPSKKMLALRNCKRRISPRKLLSPNRLWLKSNHLRKQNLLLLWMLHKWAAPSIKRKRIL